MGRPAEVALPHALHQGIAATASARAIYWQATGRGHYTGWHGNVLNGFKLKYI